MSSKLPGLVLVLAALTLVIFSAGCVGTADQTAKINDTVSVYYTQTLEDGTVYQTNVGKTPLTFVLGSGQVVKGFDNAVIGMKPGETKTVVVLPELAYGAYDNTTMKTVIPLELARAYTNKTLVPGLQFTMYDYNYGVLLGEVLAIDENSGNIGLALNHPLAGKTLTFEITLDSIGQVTP